MLQEVHGWRNHCHGRVLPTGGAPPRGHHHVGQALHEHLWHEPEFSRFRLLLLDRTPSHHLHIDPLRPGCPLDSARLQPSSCGTSHLPLPAVAMAIWPQCGGCSLSRAMTRSTSHHWSPSLPPLTSRRSLSSSLAAVCIQSSRDAPSTTEWCSAWHELNAGKLWLVPQVFMQCSPDMMMPPLVDFHVSRSPAQSLSVRTFHPVCPSFLEISGQPFSLVRGYLPQCSRR